MLEDKTLNDIYKGSNCVFYNNVYIHKHTIIGNNVVIGYPKEANIEIMQRDWIISDKLDFAETKSNRTEIGASCRIASNVVIYSGSSIGNHVSIDDFCRIGFDCKIGDDVLLLYRAHICDRVTIGNDCKIAGFICDGASIGTHCTIMGILLHKYREPNKWGLVEESPQIGNRVVIGYDAKIIGDIKIGDNSYIASGAVVTKDVPSKSIVTGINRIEYHKDWHGLMRDQYFWKWGYEESN